MIDSQAKLLAHELTIEYIRANNSCLKDVTANIPKIVDEIAVINKKFYEAIVHHKELDKLY